MIRWRLILLLAFACLPLCLPAVAGAADAAADASLRALLQQLPEASYTDKQDLIRQLTALHDARVRPVLQALLDGNLYGRANDHQVFITSAAGDGLALTDPVSASAVGTVPSDGFTRI